MRLLLATPWFLLIAAGMLSFAVEMGAWIRPVPPDLARLGGTIGGLELGPEIALEPSALGDRPPERFLYRSARLADGSEGRLFVAWYRRAQRWSGRPHDVDRCYRSLGWEQRCAARSRVTPYPWTRLFAREDESLRVVHWLEHPGEEADPIAPAVWWSRLRSPRGLRPDVVSVTLELPASATTPAHEIEAAARALSDEIEWLWNPGDME